MKLYSGFSLIEALISLLLINLVAFSLLATQLQALRISQNSLWMQTASDLTQGYIEQLRIQQNSLQPFNAQQFNQDWLVHVKRQLPVDEQLIQSTFQLCTASQVQQCNGLQLQIAWYSSEPACGLAQDVCSYHVWASL